MLLAKHAAFFIRAKTGRPSVRIMCLGKVARFPADCCFRELARYKSGSACRSSTKQGSFIITHHLNALVLNMHWTLSIIQSINQSSNISFRKYVYFLITHRLIQFCRCFIKIHTKHSCCIFSGLDFYSF